VNRELVYTVDPEVWGAQTHDYAAIAAFHLDMKKLAVEQARIAVEKAPDVLRYRSNLHYCEAMGSPVSILAPAPVVVTAPILDPVPNLVHFIWFTGSQSREFSYVNYLAVLHAREIQRPELLFMYCNEEPKDNPHWEAARELMTIVHVDPPTEIRATWKLYPQYWSDLVRLQMLEKRGGIYLDTDAILLKPLNEFMNDDCTLAGGVPPAGFRNRKPCVSAATIIARPHAPFIQRWLAAYDKVVGTMAWSGAVTDLPLELHEESPGELTLIPLGKFLPFDWTNDSALDGARRREYADLVKDSYVAHMWDTMWADRMAAIPPLYFLTLFGG
jgi:hypothetical protein